MRWLALVLPSSAFGSHEGVRWDARRLGVGLGGGAALCFCSTIFAWRFTTHALAIEDAGEDPDRWLLIGPDTAGNLLEVVVMTTVEGTQLAIHAMAMRDKYRRLLEP